MSITISDSDCWFFPGADPNEIHDLTTEDISDLIKLSEEEVRWADSVRQAVVKEERAKQNGTWKNRTRTDWLIEEMRIMNTAGTIINFPYGLRIITFEAKRHLFRGENQRYEKTVPSLNRTIEKITSPRDKEIYRVISYLRKWKFAALLWQINVVPYWEAKLSDVNFDALAQHYGFQTHLLDLTNDFKTALFFATCKYDAASDTFLPLTEADINQSEDTKYGYLFHSPDWVIDYLNGGGFMEWSAKHLPDDFGIGSRNSNRRFYLQSGDMDGVALQIGYQPLYRCHHQSGYIFPMRNEEPLQQNSRFEKMRFIQSAELSQFVYEMMDRGKAVFPNEGITEIRDMVEKLKHSVEFSMDELQAAFENDGIDKVLFPTIDELRASIQGFQLPEGKIEIKNNSKIQLIPKDLLDKVNAHYDGKDLREQVGGMIHQKEEDRQYREARCIEIYGKLI